MLQEKVKSYNEICQTIKSLNQKKKEILGSLEEEVQEGMQDLRLKLGKDSGKVSRIFNNVKVSETLSNKVKWDFNEVNRLASEDKEVAESIRPYSKLEYKMTETDYKKLDKNIQNLLVEARSLSESKSYSFEILEEEVTF